MIARIWRGRIQAEKTDDYTTNAVLLGFLEKNLTAEAQRSRRSFPRRTLVGYSGRDT